MTYLPHFSLYILQGAQIKKYYIKLKSGDEFGIKLGYREYSLLPANNSTHAKKPSFRCNGLQIN